MLIPSTFFSVASDSAVPVNSGDSFRQTPPCDTSPLLPTAMASTDSMLLLSSSVRRFWAEALPAAQPSMIAAANGVTYECFMTSPSFAVYGRRGDSGIGVAGRLATCLGAPDDDPLPTSRS